MHMTRPPQPVPPAQDPDRAAVAAVIRAETTAFQQRDYAAWARCWVQEPRTRDVYVSPATGLTVHSGWAQISRYMKHVMDSGIGCPNVPFGQENLRITLSGDTAWVVYDEWAAPPGSARIESFETRILERISGDWRIVYAAFVMRHGDPGGDEAISVDATGQLLWASPVTLARLQDHPLLTLSAGRLRAHRRDWDRALQEALRRAGQYHGYFELHRFTQETGGPFRYPAILGETDTGGLAIVHLSVRNGTTYVRIDGDAQIDRRLTAAQAVYGLSDGQVRLARQIADGKGPKEAAEALGISVNTARTHLSRLYEKTGVNAQTALVRLLLSVG
ncbi:nuclear transport factor 2 family protein [Mameliella alba]|uniref:nuclear transport factor 2 family protein n=2 Tax=Mameliella TaxID=1434019 RepID=UPI0018E2A842|nr:nuclear transport factor 2 family protein [Mameliella alba]